MISGKQVRAARGLLGWSQPQIAKSADVGLKTVQNMESGKGVSAPVSRKIRECLEKAGVEFLTGHGVRLKDASISVYEGEQGLMDVWDDIYETILLSEDKDILIANNAEPEDYNPEVEDFLKMHIKRLGAIGAQEKIIACEGDDSYFSGLIEYRQVPKEDFVSSPTIIYGDKIALWKYGPPARAIVIHDAWFAMSIRRLFGFAWKHARTPEKSA